MEVFMVLISRPAETGARIVWHRLHTVRFWFCTIKKAPRLKSVLPKTAPDPNPPATFPGPQPLVPRSHMSLRRLRDPPRRAASFPDRAIFSPAHRGTGARCLAG